MPKLCDNKSVGMLVWRNDELLLIERKKPPFGFAPPAGHVDKDTSFEVAAKRELKEEVGLEANSIEFLIEGRKDNLCRREGGNWHYWKIYKISTNGEIKRSDDETKQANWYDKNQIGILAKKTKNYLAGGISEDEWIKNPGLEPVWLEWLSELKII
ncbi:MAG: hypothetical protein CEN89_779 [Candidatus Berkelbacteria bacterium Licking1014_7]|uniref:Nudix hydrolase domain-containing protein n=1 Tax=Candidatus Berkelbacteria bacterium Licking1014_7 TaxID=2017147 RepID=A0A554LHU4_9BACT|nr:MAG: hypothetical protein CEN89_779 [Candidatus Berkelbacteria bacterium Licking1014_7]